METKPSAEKAGEQGRVLWVDTFKGICIVLVVYGHVVGGLIAAGSVPEQSVYGMLRSWVYLFHMPAFFFASGLFAPKAVRRSMKEFLRSRATTLIYPYCLWTGIVVASQVLLVRFTNNGPDLKKAMWFLVEPYGYGLWFLYALFLISLVYQLAARAGLSRIPLLVCGVLAFVLVSVGTFAFWPILNHALGYLIYFLMGAVFAREVNSWLEQGAGAKSLAMGLILLVAMTLTQHFSLGRGWGLPLVVAAMGIAGTVLLARSLVVLGLHAVWAFLGSYSMEIYLCHILLGTLPRPLLKAAGITQPGLFVACGLLSGLIGSVAIGVVCRRYRFPYLFRWPHLKPHPSSITVTI